MDSKQREFLEENESMIAGLSIALGCFLMFIIGWAVTQSAIEGVAVMFFFLMGILPLGAMLYGAYRLITDYRKLDEVRQDHMA